MGLRYGLPVSLSASFDHVEGQVRTVPVQRNHVGNCLWRYTPFFGARVRVLVVERLKDHHRRMHLRTRQDHLEEIDLLGPVQVDYADLDSELKTKLSIYHNERVIEIHRPLSSPPSSHRLSHLPRSKGIPHSASTIMGNGVSFAIALRNSGFE